MHAYKQANQNNVQEIERRQDPKYLFRETKHISAFYLMCSGFIQASTLDDASTTEWKLFCLVIFPLTSNLFYCSFIFLSLVIICCAVFVHA